jgi:Kef-type K+ transport system membrane component KefB
MREEYLAKLFLIFIVGLFFINFGLALNETDSFQNNSNKEFVLSKLEKGVWLTIAILIVALIIAFFVLAYLLNRFNQYRLISKGLSGAESAIVQKSVEKAKRI